MPTVERGPYQSPKVPSLGRAIRILHPLLYPDFGVCQIRLTDGGRF